jgi:hypothetical protein
MLATTDKITTGRLLRLAFTEAAGGRDRNRRRERVAAYVESWLDARIVSELYGPRRCYLVVALPRAVSLAAAEAFARECPHYVRGSFKLIEE